jgi:alanyl-tRNA synthetase
VKQAGSLVEAGRLRFDFSHFSSVAGAELADIDRLANRRLIENAEVTTVVTTKDEAEQAGALAFFGDKYGSTVRMVQVGTIPGSCVAAPTSTPLVRSARCSSSASRRSGPTCAGSRRCPGEAAYDHLLAVRGALDETAGLLRAPARDVPERVRGLLGR